MKTFFNIDERSIISIYKGLKPNRTDIINRINENINFVEEKETRNIMQKIINKLKTISDIDFSQIDLNDTLNDVPADLLDEIIAQ